MHIDEARHQNEPMANDRGVRHWMIDDFDDPLANDPQRASLKNMVCKNDSEIRQPHRSSLHAEALGNSAACFRLWRPDLETRRDGRMTMGVEGISPNSGSARRQFHQAKLQALFEMLFDQLEPIRRQCADDANVTRRW